mmetsp:Transcript_44653/g.112229  ORF Transcript_44653/g.112229 Transcript_44653/m.112229 type:complete len:211 (-) Transcript_44653:2369-3001(-)
MPHSRSSQPNFGVCSNCKQPASKSGPRLEAAETGMLWRPEEGSGGSSGLLQMLGEDGAKSGSSKSARSSSLAQKQPCSDSSSTNLANDKTSTPTFAEQPKYSHSKRYSDVQATSSPLKPTSSANLRSSVAANVPFPLTSSFSKTDLMSVARSFCLPGATAAAAAAGLSSKMSMAMEMWHGLRGVSACMCSTSVVLKAWQGGTTVPGPRHW